MIAFSDKLKSTWEDLNSLLTVGLDPSEAKLPEVMKSEEEPFFAFNRAIIDATAEFCCAYKPQFAYYAGADRLSELKKSIAYIKENYPKHLVILDVKRNDIGSTAEAYAAEAFDVYGADALTVNPYMGGDTLEPFTRRQDKGVIVLCKTSNPGSTEIQNLQCEGKAVFEVVAQRAAQDWNNRKNIGLVIGATYPEEMGKIRDIAPGLYFLVPGIGAQGGDLKATMEQGLNKDGTGLLINSSRGIIYASSDANFANAAGSAAKELNDNINNLRSN